MKDQDLFINEFLRLVDTESSIENSSIAPWEIKSDYFGNIEWNNFKIFRLKRYFLQRRILLIISGKISKSTLTATIKHYYQGPFLLSSIILTFLSFLLMTELNFYFGLALIIIVAIQIAVTLNQFENGKKEFIDLIERINNK